jgi:hypothetical protein
MLGCIVFAWEKITRTVEMLFYQSRIHQLGHVISCEGTVVDLVKVEVVMEWSVSTNVPKVSNFVCLARYYQRFVEGFSKIAIQLWNCRTITKSLCGSRNVRNHFEGSKSC